uniref:Uncharacterized protein n=1 Tax=Candidatus Kentrum eta TaxID=2126337 RepID=A0A450VLY6_9GAMM|nr:MAG: hypothetical protein BECKH772B_GA0070898_103132 [Candidatus Kentron sp. H]VFK03197.1 MAG: hypothetical protein BECKH772A_GA0070896_103102 [Candidatus Kentron sp. H]VFK05813.1 MAG: hypothetical protein BECKH772C_GA0070978_103042 [Candidatus Kentron sp. H]
MLISVRLSKNFRTFSGIEKCTSITGKVCHFLCDTTYALGFNNAYGKTSKTGDVLRCVSGLDSTSVFIEIPIDDMVATFNSPTLLLDSRLIFCT